MYKRQLLECPQRGILVNEINHTMEFRNSIEPTGVNIPGRIIDWVIQVAQRQGTRGNLASQASQASLANQMTPSEIGVGSEVKSHGARTSVALEGTR